MRPWLLLAGLNGLMGVAFAAIGAHVVDGALAPLVDRASQFQLIHAVALLAVGALAEQGGGRTVRAAGVLFVAGIVLFSGSLYWKALVGPLSLPMITPAGGMAFMLGWAVMTVAAASRPRPRPGWTGPLQNGNDGQ